MTREALFNVLGPDVAGSRFLDLFSGSGAVGIEAVSRGASSAVMVEKDSGTCGIIRQNIDTCGFGGRCRLLKGDVMNTLRRLDAESAEFDLVFMDPPYADGSGGRINGVYAEVLEFLAGSCVVAPGGIIIAEHGFPLEECYGCFRAFKTRRYGISHLTFFERGT